MKKTVSKRLATLVLAFGLLAAGLAAQSDPALAKLLFGLGTQSENGLYKIVAGTTNSPLPPVGPIHVWLLTVQDAEGNPVTGATITIDGGMAAHGHGLPTAPEVVSEDPPGTYHIDGVKFSMIGEWQLRFTIDSPLGKDTAEISFTLK